jgi:Cu-processing system ATP-binding protein
MQKNTLINYQDVCFSYGNTQVLFDINFKVNQGESIAIVGHNGAGKTTLIKLLIGVLTASSGDTGVSKYTQTNKISFMPEHNALYEHLRGIDLMLYFAKLKGVNPSEIEKILDLVEIKFAANKKISSYSKGMKQRLLLAQALLSEPEVLVLDEPYSGLDPNSRILFSSILKDLNKKGKSIILSSHTLEGLSSIVSNIIFINQGRIALSGRIDKIVNNLNLHDKMEILVQKNHSIDEIIQPIKHLIESYKFTDNKLNIFHYSKNNMAILRIISNIGLIENISTTKAGINDAYHHLYREK